MIYVMQTCPECGGETCFVRNVGGDGDRAKWASIPCHVCCATGVVRVAAAGNEEFEELIMGIIKRKTEERDP